MAHSRAKLGHKVEGEADSDSVWVESDSLYEALATFGNGPACGRFRISKQNVGHLRRMGPLVVDSVSLNKTLATSGASYAAPGPTWGRFGFCKKALATFKKSGVARFLRSWYGKRLASR